MNPLLFLILMQNGGRPPQLDDKDIRNICIIVVIVLIIMFGSAYLMAKNYI